MKVRFRNERDPAYAAMRQRIEEQLQPLFVRRDEQNVLQSRDVFALHSIVETYTEQAAQRL